MTEIHVGSRSLRADLRFFACTGLHHVLFASSQWARTRRRVSEQQASDLL